MKSLEKHSLLHYNTFQVDAIADHLTIFTDEMEAESFFKNTPSKAENTLVIGEGSNLLFTSDYKGGLFKIENKGIYITDERSHSVWVKVAAGENWDDLVAWAVRNGYGGIENLSYIPGTVGAAPVQNIGAYGVEFADVFNSLEAIDMQTGEKQRFYLQELAFAYRDSVFKKELRNKYLITSVIIKLSKFPELVLNYGNIKKELELLTNKPTISDVRTAIIKIRKSKLPDPKEIGNAGSFFKNPVVNAQKFNRLISEFPEMAHYILKDNQYKIAAAWLIEKAGLKGYILGQAATHPNHSLILINNGNASGMEIKKLAEFIQKTVDEKFGVSLETEVLML